MNEQYDATKFRRTELAEDGLGLHITLHRRAISYFMPMVINVAMRAFMGRTNGISAV